MARITPQRALLRFFALKPVAPRLGRFLLLTGTSGSFGCVSDRHGGEVRSLSKKPKGEKVSGQVALLQGPGS